MPKKARAHPRNQKTADPGMSFDVFCNKRMSEKREFFRKKPDFPRQSTTSYHPGLFEAVTMLETKSCPFTTGLRKKVPLKLIFF
jgi:hypothetical protein